MIIWFLLLPFFGDVLQTAPFEGLMKFKLLFLAGVVGVDVLALVCVVEVGDLPLVFVLVALFGAIFGVDAVMILALYASVFFVL